MAKSLRYMARMALPPHVVRWEDGTTTELFPGSDVVRKARIPRSEQREPEARPSLVA